MNKPALFCLGLICCMSMWACKMAKDNNRVYTVTGSIYLTSDYCGGANPPEELLENLKTPKPYQGKKIYLRAGNTNNFEQPILYSIITDTAGKFILLLPKGDYCIVDEYRTTAGYTDSLFVDKVPNLKMTDPWCIKQWCNECLIQFKIDNKNLSIEPITIHQQCFRPDGVPCLQYTGELPK